MATRKRTRVDFSQLGWCAARIGRATVNWRLKMGLGPIPEGFDPEDGQRCECKAPDCHGARCAGRPVDIVSGTIVARRVCLACAAHHARTRWERA